MTVYFFDIVEKDGTFQDSEGTEFADDDGAAGEALAVLFEAMRDLASTTQPGHNLAVTARTASGRMAFYAVLQLQTTNYP